jgi:DNA-binding protein H-NS
MARRNSSYEKMPLSELVRLRDEIRSVLDRRLIGERKALEKQMAVLGALERGFARPSTAAGHETGPRRKARAPRARPHPLKGKTAAAKYRGPNGETWAGRGLTPRWLTALEKKGKKRDQYLIAHT